MLPIADWGDGVGRRLFEAIAARPALRLCLPTGSTPMPAYRSFAHRGGSLRDATVFLLDEFGLPPGHPARGDSMIRRTLLDHLEGPPQHMHALDPAASDLVAECHRYEAAVLDGGLDLTLLGLGGNGHLGLNEPGSERATRTRRVALAAETIEHAEEYGSGERPAWGLTMGIRTILESREVWLLVTGAHKAAILRRALSGPIGAEVPASYLRTHRNALVLADEAAAVQLG